jgi:stage II sporulation SpoE-like protein/GAF domain-containing protein
VTEDPDATAGRQVRLPRPALPAEDHPAVTGGGLSLGAGIDLAEITRLTLDASVPGFAGGASVFALEHLLKEGESAGPPAAGQGAQVVARRLGTKFARQGRRVPGGAFPPGEVIAFAANSPLTRCVSSGRPVRFSEADRQVMERLGPAGREVLAGYTSFLAVPMTARDTVTGFLVLVRAPGVPAFSERDAAAATRLGAQAGAGILNALALIRQRSIADALQRGLLAAEPAVPPGLEIAGRCLPAAGHVIGGDWYDVIPLPGNRTGLVVGDVMGHGPEAAAVMAQLRTTAHALADLDLAPADLLQRLNRVTTTLQRITLATCAYAIIDADSHTCTLAGAGHLPPILALPDGTTRVPELPAGQSLGIGPASYGQARIKLPPGAILALYTDGLVESRTRSFDQGILALRSVLAREHGNLEAIGDALIASLAGRCEDDITVILARIPPAG